MGHVGLYTACLKKCYCIQYEFIPVNNQITTSAFHKVV